MNGGAAAPGNVQLDPDVFPLTIMRNYYLDSPNGGRARSQLRVITNAIQTLVYQTNKVLFQDGSGLFANFFITSLPMQEILEARQRFDQHYQIYDRLICELAIPVDYAPTFQQCFAVLRKYVYALKNFMVSASQAQVHTSPIGGYIFAMHLADRNKLIEYLAVLRSETGIDPMNDDQ